MSTEIKPGQVWAWNADIDADESQFRITAVEGDRARYEYLSENDPHLAGGFFHTVDTLTEKAHLVSEPDATPAPLDPSQKARVEIADWDDFQEFDVVVQMPGLDGGPFVVERQQPAPEPEPEWKPGTTGTATLNNLVSGNSAVGLRAMRTGSQESRPGFALENGMHITDDSSTYSVSDFVPDETRPLLTEAELTEAMYGVVTNLRATAADYAAAVHAHLVRNASLRGESR